MYFVPSLSPLGSLSSSVCVGLCQDGQVVAERLKSLHFPPNFPPSASAAATLRQRGEGAAGGRRRRGGLKEFEGMVDHLRLVSRYCRESIITYLLNKEEKDIGKEHHLRLSGRCITLSATGSDNCIWYPDTTESL